MNEAACIVCIGAFLVLPPAVLVTRLVDKERMPWVLVAGSSVIGGWLLANLAYKFYVNDLLLRMSATGDVMYGDPNTFPKNDFLFTFGWLFGPAYLMPWLFPYGVFVFVRRMMAGRAM